MIFKKERLFVLPRRREKILERPFTLDLARDFCKKRSSDERLAIVICGKEIGR
jgi:hypothetical protein